MTLRKAFTLLASYFGFIAALTIAVCLAFGTRIQKDREQQAAIVTAEKPQISTPPHIKSPVRATPLKPGVAKEPPDPSPAKVQKAPTLQAKVDTLPQPASQKSADTRKSKPSTLKYTLEVKVYRDFDAAENLRIELAKNKIRAYIVPTTVENETFYRVRVGKFKTEAKAIETGKMFHKVTQIPTRIVKM